MTNEDQNLWLVFNGEIYNYASLRRELIRKGHKFCSQADSEVLLHGYEEYGKDILDRLTGIFSFVIFDKKRSKVFCGRDHLGVKPFYYYFDDKNFFVASEPKAILSYPGLDTSLRQEGFIDYFQYFFVPGPKTIWNRVCQLSPGSYLEFNLGETPKPHSYWKLPTEIIKSSTVQAEEEGWDLLMSSIESQMVSDVPVGVFLSGGYDSATLLWKANQISPGIGSYTIGFEGFSRSEEAPAREISNLIGSKHEELILPENFMDELESLFQWYDEPYAITSMVSYFKVSELASGFGKVVLAGDGGDEVFGGYRWYNQISQFSKKTRLRRLFWSQEKNLNTLKERYQMVHGGGKQNLFRYRELLSQEILKHDNGDLLWPYETPADYQLKSPVKLFQYLDFKRFITEANLIRADRSSMANSLEVRVPFLDPKLVERSLSWPEHAFFSDRSKKPILRKQLDKIYPASILDLPKRGFGNPTHHFFENLNDRREMLKNSPLFTDGILNQEIRNNGFKDLGRTDFWLIVVLDLWYNKWVLGKK